LFTVSLFFDKIAVVETLAKIAKALNVGVDDLIK